MSHNELAAPRVVAVLLADGWHRIVPSSFSIGPLDSIIAVRQVAPATRRVGDLDRARAARYGHPADEVPRRAVPAGR